MHKLTPITALLLAIAFTLTACCEGEPRQPHCTYGWLFINGEKMAEGYVTWWIYNDDRITVDIDGKRYRTAAENVVIVEMPEPNQPEEMEVHPC